MAWLTKHSEVVYTDLEEGAVVLNLETGFYYSLNEIGKVVWRLVDSAGSLEDLIQKLQDWCEVDAGQAKISLSRFLQELEMENLVMKDLEGTGGTHQNDGGQLEKPPRTKMPFVEPELLKHDEPLHEVVMNPFDPQLPLAE